MKLIVGLGNPGRKYADTRHNVGFDVLAELARRHAATGPKSKFQGELCEAQINQSRVLLLCPQTYMNNSGASVQPAAEFYKLSNEDLLVVCDDFNLPLAKIRFRARGSSGGQKGLADIINRLGEDVSRLRIGIGSPNPGWDVADFVLSKFDALDKADIDAAIQRAADGAEDWVKSGIEHCMNVYNAG